MSDWKKIWHVVDGVDRIPESATHIVLWNPLMTSVSISRSEFLQLSIADRFRLEFTAYTTGQMRRRVECSSGCRYGCSCCNGKGYLWEYK